MTKIGSSFDIRVVIYIEGELAWEIFVIGECLYYGGCSEVFMYFSFRSFTFTSCILIF